MVFNDQSGKTPKEQVLFLKTLGSRGKRDLYQMILQGKLFIVVLEILKTWPT